MILNYVEKSNKEAIHLMKIVILLSLPIFKRLFTTTTETPSIIPQSGSGEDKIYADLTSNLEVERLFPLDPWILQSGPKQKQKTKATVV